MAELDQYEIDVSLDLCDVSHIFEKYSRLPYDSTSLLRHRACTCNLGNTATCQDIWGALDNDKHQVGTPYREWYRFCRVHLELVRGSDVLRQDSI